jgi:hypothetical protein
MGGISRLLEEAPEDLSGRSQKSVTSEVILADAHSPDEAALPASYDRKCAGKLTAVSGLFSPF